jgi:hypothetical protein
MTHEDICCPRFNPEPWEDQEITWDEKLFVKARVRSLFHIPLNFGGVMKRQMGLILAADAAPDDADVIVMADHDSPWGADVYISVVKDVPGAQMATVSGRFLSKVFEGPYKDMKKWAIEMKNFVDEKECDLEKIYFYYTTCPKCAKKYDENYVVLLAKVG